MTKDTKDKIVRQGLTVTVTVDGELVRMEGMETLLKYSVESCAQQLAGRLFQEIQSKMDLVEIAKEVRKKIIADNTERFLAGLESQEELRKLRTRLILLEAFAGPLDGEAND